MSNRLFWYYLDNAKRKTLDSVRTESEGVLAEILQEVIDSLNEEERHKLIQGVFDLYFGSNHLAGWIACEGVARELVEDNLLPEPENWPEDYLERLRIAAELDKQ